MSEPEIESEEQEAEAEPAGATDNVGDISVEVNVEELIAQLETEGKATPIANGQARRKIEDILEEKRVAREIMDIDDYDIED
jgi:translation elongation factor EF-Tu-like GTPase